MPTPAPRPVGPRQESEVEQSAAEAGWGSDGRARESGRWLQERRDPVPALLGGPEAPGPEPRGPAAGGRGAGRESSSRCGPLLWQRQDIDRAQCLDPGERESPPPPMGHTGQRGGRHCPRHDGLVPQASSQGQRARKEATRRPGRTTAFYSVRWASGHRTHPVAVEFSRTSHTRPCRRMSPPVSGEAAPGPFSPLKCQPDSAPSASASPRPWKPGLVPGRPASGVEVRLGSRGAEGGLAARRGAHAVLPWTAHARHHKIFFGA